ncbi:hypothetical protein CLU84_2691 [Comamonas sp. 26]|nr:hypothetical protein CLU84_2691 [Comamonas sp. 26]
MSSHDNPLIDANRGSEGLPEDRDYLLHHFNCPYCISAGATPGMQERCPEGLQLWDAYNQATRPQPNTRRQRPSPDAGYLVKTRIRP